MKLPAAICAALLQLLRLRGLSAIPDGAMCWKDLPARWFAGKAKLLHTEPCTWHSQKTAMSNTMELIRVKHNQYQVADSFFSDCRWKSSIFKQYAKAGRNIGM